MVRRLALLAALACLLSTLVFVPCLAMVMTDNHGRWPQDWPKELEPLRDRSQTIGVATGLQMDIYQIPFDNREEFERVWPAILRVKSDGGALTLYQVNTKAEGWPSVSNDKPCVRIYAPSGGTTSAPDPAAPEGAGAPEPRTYEEMQELVKDGKALNSAPPWPLSAHLGNGELSEYVVAQWVDGRLTWIPAKFGGGKAEFAGFLHRARVDIVLVVDGNIVDLNRIHLPANTPIIDKRGLAPEGEQAQ